ncbi:MAG: hypothetical protein WKF87_03885 [Chryseolinea sp.]
MRYVIALLMLTVLVRPSIGQFEPKLNDEEVLKKLKVESVSTFYYDNEDTTRATRRLLFKKEYDNSGNLISKYHLSLWDVVSYDHTTTYSYDKNNNLIEKVILQKIIDLGKRDEKFIKEMGDDPINERFTYQYGDNNQILKEERYTFGKEGYDKNQKPDNTVVYEYAKGLLVKEVSTTPNGVLVYQNYTATYDYNSLKQKIRETKIFTTQNNNPQRTIAWTYNEKGLIVEEIIDDNANPLNNKRVKYEYDNNGRIIHEFHFSVEKNKWETIKTNTYSKNGNLVLDDEETTFDYYKNGLVRRELWKSRDSEETVNFITTYRFR